MRVSDGLIGPLKPIAVKRRSFSQVVKDTWSGALSLYEFFFPSEPRRRGLF